MPTGYEVDAYRDLTSIAKSLKVIASTLIDIRDGLHRPPKPPKDADGEERKKPTA